MEQNSRLNVVVDTRDAVTQLATFTQKLKDAEAASRNTASELAKLKTAAKDAGEAFKTLNSAASGKKGLANLAAVLSAPTQAAQRLGTQLSTLTFTVSNVSSAVNRLSPVMSNLAGATRTVTPATTAASAALSGLTFSLAGTATAAVRFSPLMGAAAAAAASVAPVAGATSASLSGLSFALVGAGTAAVRFSPLMGAAAAAAAALPPVLGASVASLGGLSFAFNAAATTATRYAPLMGAAAAATGRLAPVAAAAVVQLNTLTFTISRMNTVAAQLSPSLGAVGRAAALAQANAANLNRAAGQLNPTLARTTAQSEQLNNTWRRSNNTARGLIGSLYDMKNVLSTIVFAATGFGFLKTADEMQNLSTQIKLVTNGTHEFNIVNARLREIADENYNSIDATVSLYQKSARALANLGKSQHETLVFTDAVSLAMRTGGRSAGEQAAAILQLGQAMGSGVLMGDEFRSIAENAPILLDLVSKRMGVLQGDLKELASEGKITAEIMYDAFSQNMGLLEDLAKKIPLSMGQALTVAKNKYREYINDTLNTTGGVSSKIAKLIVGIGDNFETIAKGGITIAVFGVLQLATTIGTATKAMALFNLVAKANPLLLIAAGFLAVNSAIFGFNDTIDIAGLVVGDLFTQMGRGLKAMETAWGDLADEVARAMGRTVVDVADANDKNTKNFLGFYNKTETGFAGVVQGMSVSFGAMGLVITTLLETIGRTVFDMVVSLENVGRAAHNAGSWVREQLGFESNRVDYKEYQSVNPFTNYQDKLSTLVDGTRAYARGLNERSGVAPAPYKAPLRSPYFNGGFSGVMRGGQGVYAPKAGALPDYLRNNQASLLPMDAEKKAQYDLSQANAALALARKEEEKLSKERAKADKAAAKAAAAATLPVNSKVLGHAKTYDYASIEKEYGLPSGLLAAMSMQESRGVETARSPVGAKGAFQLMPATAKRFNAGGQEFDVGKSAVAAAKYMQWLLERFGSLDLALAGYNAGEGNVDKYKGIPPFKETRKYVPEVKARLNYMQGGVDGSTNISGLVSAQIDAVRRAEEELARIQKEMADKRISVQNEYGDKELQINAKLKKDLEEIQSAGFSETQAVEYANLAIGRAEAEKAVYKKSLDDQLEELKAFTYNERDVIERARRNELFAINTDKELIRPENAELLKANRDAVNAKYDYELVMFNTALGNEINALQAYKRTERAILEDSWDYRIAEAKNSYSLLAEAQVEAFNEQKTLELAQIDLAQQHKLLEINKIHMTEMQYLREKYALDQELNRLSNESPEFKNAQSRNNTKTMEDAAGEVRKRVGGAYDGQTRGLYAVDGRENDLTEQWREQQRIAQEARDEEIITEEQHKARLLALDQQYINEKKGLLSTGYGEAWGVAASAMKLFGGEQSKAYRLMFYVEKGYVLQSAIMKEKLAIMDAWSNTQGGYFAKAMAAGKVLMQTGLITQAISAISPRGFKTGGFTGNIGANNIAGMVHGNEYVFDAQATKNIGVNNLDALRSGKGGIGETNVSINVTVAANGSSQVSGDTANAMGRKMAQGMKQVALDVIRQEKRQGGMLYA